MSPYLWLKKAHEAGYGDVLRLPVRLSAWVRGETCERKEERKKYGEEETKGREGRMKERRRGRKDRMEKKERMEERKTGKKGSKKKRKKGSEGKKKEGRNQH